LTPRKSAPQKGISVGSSVFAGFTEMTNKRIEIQKYSTNEICATSKPRGSNRASIYLVQMHAMPAKKIITKTCNCFPYTVSYLTLTTKWIKADEIRSKHLTKQSITNKRDKNLSRHTTKDVLHVSASLIQQK